MSDMLGWLIPGLLTIWLAIRAFKKDAKESTSVDAKQNEKLIEIEGKISTLNVELNTLKTRIDVGDTKIYKELDKIESKLDKYHDLVLQLMKP